MTDDAPRLNSGPRGPESEINRLLDQKVRYARLALFWERLWPLLMPPAVLVGAFMALGLFGLWQGLPPIAHIVALGLALVAIGFSLAPLVRLRWPTRDEGRARLDLQSGHLHKPVESFDDRLAPGADSTQQAVWAVHRDRLREKVRNTPVHTPKPRLWERDPFAIRAVVALLLIVALAYAGPDWWNRVSTTVTPGAIAQSEPARLDAWITPPNYTAKPPIFLADGARTVAEIDTPSGVIDVPTKSELVLRLHGGSDVELTLTGADGAEIPLAAPQSETQVSAGKPTETASDEANRGEFQHTLTANATLALTSGETVYEWQLNVIPDNPPAINFAEATETTSDEALQIAYTLKDDYGAVSAKAGFKVVETDEPQQLGEQPGDAGGKDGPRLEVAAPDFDLLLPGNRVRDVTRTAYKDLTAHPWAGIDVEVTLTATDEAGQIGKSEARHMVLPQRRFVDPMSRAVIEQRRNLVRTPWRRERIAIALDALTIAPERYIEDLGVFLGLRTAIYRTEEIATNEDLSDVVDLLWDIALRIEDGDLSLAERELRAAQDALQRALAENAPQEEIDRLLQEMREALNRFMQAMREEAMRNASRQPQQQIDPSQMVQSQDLDKLMDMIEQLAKSGANDAAQQLLEQLRNMLENLDSAIAQGQMSPEQGQMSQTLDELGRMIGEQQRLMDETFRQNGQQGQMGQQGQQGQQGQGQRGQNGQGQNGQGMSLAERQDALRQQLQQLMDQMAQGGMPVPGQLPRAGGEMGSAQDRLSQGQPGEALGPQGSAIDQLREGARSMAQQMLDGMAAQQGRNGRGQTRADGRTDPLGRPRQTTGPDFGLSVKIPDEIDAETARRLREELQRRLGDRTRRLLELDYLERLLRRFQ